MALVNDLRELAASSPHTGMLHVFLGELHVLLLEAGAVLLPSARPETGPCTAVVARGACWLPLGKVGLVLLCTSLWKVNRLISEPLAKIGSVTSQRVNSLQKVFPGFSRGQSGYVPVLNISKFSEVTLP